MKCPYCNAVLSGEDECKSCGMDVKVFYKAEYASNRFYNQGLQKAKVHDLSGAIIDLKKSLKLNKRNTKARNLLGLVYYEMGEVVSGLSEWVVCRHFDEEDKMAEGYLNEVQSRPTKMENFNKSFRKFNLALEAVKQNNEDLALMHLKKALNLNPHFIKAMHLLVLIYIKQDELEKAKRILKRAKKLDISNTKTLAYLAEVKTREEENERLGNESSESSRGIAIDLAPLGEYREDKPNMLAIINLVIGLLVGVGIMAFLVVPNVKKEAAKKYNIAVLEDIEGTSEKSAKTLNDENEKLQKDLSDREKKIKELENNNAVNYNDLFAASKNFIDGDKEKAAENLAKCDESKIKSDEAKALYNYIKEEVYADTIQQYSEEGRVLCNQGKMEEAIEVLEKAYDISKDDPQVLYFLGRSYQKLDKKKEAKKYFDELIEKFPDDSRTAIAKTRLSEMGY